VTDASEHGLRDGYHGIYLEFQFMWEIEIGESWSEAKPDRNLKPDLKKQTRTTTKKRLGAWLK
jgi:hypothetical protein